MVARTAQYVGVSWRTMRASARHWGARDDAHLEPHLCQCGQREDAEDAEGADADRAPVLGAEEERDGEHHQDRDEDLQAHEAQDAQQQRVDRLRSGWALHHRLGHSNRHRRGLCFRFSPGWRGGGWRRASGWGSELEVVQRIIAGWSEQNVCHRPGAGSKDEARHAQCGLVSIRLYKVPSTT